MDFDESPLSVKPLKYDTLIEHIKNVCLLSHRNWDLYNSLGSLGRTTKNANLETWQETNNHPQAVPGTLVGAGTCTLITSYLKEPIWWAPHCIIILSKFSVERWPEIIDCVYLHCVVLWPSCQSAVAIKYCTEDTLPSHVILTSHWQVLFPSFSLSVHLYSISLG